MDVTASKTAENTLKTVINGKKSENTLKTRNPIENTSKTVETVIKQVFKAATAAFSRIILCSQKAKSALVKMRITAGADEDQSGLVFVLCSMLETAEAPDHGMNALVARAMENVLIAFFRGNRVGQSLCGKTLRMAGTGNAVSFGRIMLVVVSKAIVEGF